MPAWSDDKTRDRAAALRRSVVVCLACASPLAAQTEPAHPILSISGSGSTADSILSTWTETQYLGFVPQQSSRRNSFGFVPAVVPGDTGWSWNSSTPNQIGTTATTRNAAFQAHFPS